MWSLHPHTPRSLLRAGRVLGGNTSCTVTVKNTGDVGGDEVVQVFVSPSTATRHARSSGPDPMALKRLVAFQRVTLAAGDSVDIPFSFDPTALADVDASGSRVIWPGEYTFFVGRGHGEEVLWGARVELLSQGEGGKDDRVWVRRYPQL